MLRVENLSKAFGGNRALQGLTFHVGAGEVYGLLGPNGAGKSTTFSIICNLLKADAGSVQLDGQSPDAVAKTALGVVAQQIALYKNLSCLENLRFFSSIYGIRGKTQDSRIATCLAAVGLSERANSRVRTLSGGMQRRLHVGVALLHEPRIVILDEPSAGMDVESRQEMWALIRRMQSEGKAVLLTTHLLEEAEYLCARIGFLETGAIIAEGSPEELKARIPAEEVVVIQSSKMTAVTQVAEKRGLQYRLHEHGLAVWLRQRMDLRDVLGLFDGAPIDSISRRSVQLEDVYLELRRPRS
jgi:ABC-2 type transport system ATP-binding protein